MGGYCKYRFFLPHGAHKTNDLQVFGNVVQGKKIAGLVYIVQESTQSLQGFITSINLTTGHFVVDNEVECVLNDVRSLQSSSAYSTH